MSVKRKAQGVSLAPQKRAMVVHQGKRDNYEVCKALVQVGYSVTLVTSGYGTRRIGRLAALLPLHGLKKMAGRRAEGLPDESVIALLWTELAALFLNKLKSESVALEWIDKRMAEAAIRELGAGQYSLIVCYNYNAFRIFNDRSAATARKVIFQCHPHPLLVRETFSALQAQGLAPEMLAEKEFSYSPEYQAMLVAEPHLAERVVCASTFTKKSLVRAGVKENSIRVVPYGVNFGKSAVARTDLSSPTDRPLRIIFVGQFVYRKGLAVIFEILNRLNFKVHISFVGRGIKEVAPETRVYNQNVTTSIHWDVPIGDLVRLYQESDVFLFPSIVEGFAQVVLEAMEMGCVPVVSCNTCGPDVIESGKEGFVFDPDNIDGYVSALDMLRAPSLRSEFAIACATKAREFTWQRFRTQFMDAIS